MDKNPRRKWFQCRLRTLVVGLLATGIFLSYVGSYYWLSRRGMREAKVSKMPGFLYVPLDEAAATEDLSEHYRRTTFYAPLNWLDVELFGGERPIGNVIWRLTP